MQERSLLILHVDVVGQTGNVQRGQLGLNQRTGTIGSDNHRAVLFIKSINDLLQRIRTAIYIVAIELDGKLATSRMMHTHVPATADPRIGTFRNQMNHTSVCRYIFRLLRKFRLSNGYPQ